MRLPAAVLFLVLPIALVGQGVLTQVLLTLCGVVCLFGFPGGYTPRYGEYELGSSSARRAGGAPAAGGGSLIPWTPARETQKSELFWQSAAATADIVERSSTLNVAIDAYVDGVMSLGVTVAGTDTPASQYETMFLRSLIKNLVVYGYTNYRRLTSDDSEEHVYQVPGGDESAVRFDPDELAWIADHRSDSSDPKLAEITADEAPFSTIVLMPPLETRPDGYGARAFRDAERIEAMLENHSRRDAHNSMPGVFTFVDNDAFQTRGRAGGQGWLSSGLDIDATTGMEGATRSLNYNDLVAAREEMVRSAAAATSRERPTFRVGASLPLGLPGDHDDDEADGEQTHREYVVTDGRKTTTAPHLHGPSQETLLYQRFRQSIFQVMSVPPQAIGESVSAERVGSNQRSTSVVLAAWEDRKTAIRRVLPMAECGLAWGSKIDSFLYERILPVLKKDKAVEVAASVLGVEPGDIDPVRIQTLQDTMLNGGTRATCNDPESTKPAERRHKTEADRDTTEKARDTKPE